MEDAPGNWIHILQDGLGSVHAEVNSSGAVVASQNRDKWAHIPPHIHPTTRATLFVNFGQGHVIANETLQIR